MGWAFCGEDDQGRPIGYGVEATCDMLECSAEIDRGLSYVCGPMHGGDTYACGGYFCGEHLWFGGPYQMCEVCYNAFFNEHPFFDEWNGVDDIPEEDEHTLKCDTCSDRVLENYWREKSGRNNAFVPGL